MYELKEVLKTVITKEYLLTEEKLTVYFNTLNSDKIISNQNQTVISMPEIIFRTYWRRAWVVTLWLLVCISLFTWKFIQYKHRAAFQVMGYCLSTAKGAAETLKLNMALILLPVCRNLLTCLRKSPHISSIVPFNDNINFHKVKPPTHYSLFISVCSANTDS